MSHIPASKLCITYTCKWVIDITATYLHIPASTRAIAPQPQSRSLLLYYCFTNALLLLYCCLYIYTYLQASERSRKGASATVSFTTALLLPYYCFTTALLLLYYCFTTALLLLYLYTCKQAIAEGCHSHERCHDSSLQRPPIDLKKK
jgi:hypothetical protein